MSHQEDRSRSVNDFDTAEGLRLALRSDDYRGAYADVARDFPRSLLCNIPGTRDEDDLSECSSVVEIASEHDWVLTNYNAEIAQTQSLQEEMKRLQVLKSYLILDAPREARFERLTALASRMFRVPIALVSLVDLGRQWFMSNRGLGDAKETPRRHAFCAHAILSKEDLFIVPDASTDPRFMENPLVTGPPHIRFYAGAPLMCPEGYKLGTLCIIDSKSRQEGLSLEEKQNLRELADLVVDAMVERRRDKMRVLQDKSQIIACTAHDLLTPLSGVQLSLSLLLEDEDLRKCLTETQKELIMTAGSCSDVMNRICHHAIDTFRVDVAKHNREQEAANKNDVGGPRTVVVEDLVKKLSLVMEPYPKSVPLTIVVDPSVPEKIVADDLKIFRSAVNYLTNACKKTKEGSVVLKIYVSGTKQKRKKLVFECQDTGPGVPVELYEYLFRPFREETTIAQDSCLQLDSKGELAGWVCSIDMENSGLGLYSVAHQISSIEGEYGFRPGGVKGESDGDSGAVFWFSIPLRLPKVDSNHDNAENPVANNARIAPIVLRPIRSFGFGSRQSGSNTPNGSVGSDHEFENVAASLNQVATNGKPMKGRDRSDLMGQVESLTRKIKVLSEAQQTSQEERPPVKEQGLKARRVRQSLVIDDSVVIRKSLHRALSKMGYEVKVATNGLEGLKEMQEEMFDVVFCDFLMPVMDGLDCVQQYREWESVHRPWFKQYIVGISAHASPNDVEKGRAAGMDDFKAKPVTLNMLKELQGSEKLKEVSKALDDLGERTDMVAEVPQEVEIDSKAHSYQNNDVESGPVCLVAEDSSFVSKFIVSSIGEFGWRAVVVRDGEDALRLLKTRNWAAVFLEENLPRLTGIRCKERFREWEREHRVARQNNIFLLSDSLIPNPSTDRVISSCPPGFDAALGKPILRKDLNELIELAASHITGHAESGDIVPR